ncbi:MAG: glycosyltransferase [Verrucomicrobiota bacterium]
MSKKIKLWIATGSLSGGGAESQIHLLASHLDPGRFDIRIGYLTKNESDPTFPEHVSLIHLSREKTWQWHRVWSGIQDDFRLFKPNLVHVWLPDTIIIPAAVVSKMQGHPVISSIRRSTFKGISRSYFPREAMGLLPHLFSSRIVSNFPITEEPWIVKRLCSWRGNMVIPNGVDTRRQAGPHEANSDKLRLMYVGRFARQKNLPFLIRVLGEIKRRGNVSCHLSIFGKGVHDQKAVLEKLIKEVGLSGDDVAFEGYRTDWRRESGRFDYMVFPSLSEGMPNVVAEAMAEGVPVIASDIVETAPLVIAGENGFRFDPTISHELIEIIESVPRGDEHWNKLSHSAANKANEYSITQMVATYEQLYERIA